MTRDKLAALDRAALRKLIADTAADLSAQKELWTAGDLAEALIATGKLVLIDDGAVEAVPKPTRAQMEYKWKRRAEESEARATAAEAREARLLEALRKIEAGKGIGGPDAELQCADIARAAIEENQRGQG